MGPVPLARGWGPSSRWVAPRGAAAAVLALAVAQPDPLSLHTGALHVVAHLAHAAHGGVGRGRCPAPRRRLAR